MREPQYIFFFNELNQFSCWVDSNSHIKALFAKLNFLFLLLDNLWCLFQYLSGSIFFFLSGTITLKTILWCFKYYIFKRYKCIILYFDNPYFLQLFSLGVSSNIIPATFYQPNV